MCLHKNRDGKGLEGSFGDTPRMSLPAEVRVLQLCTSTVNRLCKMTRNVFLLGHDDFHARYLEHLQLDAGITFQPLLRSDELVYQDNYDIDGLLDRARTVVDDFDGSVDGIITHWDFPAASMLAILCDERGLPAPSLEATLKCSHKYWSRVEQHKVSPESTPDFCAVDPFDDKSADKISIDYPFWIKPVKGYGSALGFKVEKREDLEAALEEAREKIERLGDPVNRLLDRVEMPPDVRGVDGNHMIAEAFVGGKEIAPEGYVQGGRFHAHGMFDMVRGSNGKSFHRYHYPSTAPESVKRRALDICERVLHQVGFDHGCFNVEFFWDRDQDRLWIIEVNPRLSQSHSNLFEKVDGTSNHAVAVQLALGEEPHFEHGNGPFAHAAKFLYRRYDKTDAVAVRVPDDEDLAALEQRQPDTEVQIKLEKGMRLTELLDEDAYSYVLAELHIGADSIDEIEQKFEDACELLPFEFDPVA